MNKTLIFVIFTLIILFAGIVIWQLIAYRVAEPTYQVVQKEGNIEIRDYAPFILARVAVGGERYDSIVGGFKILAGYIFGKNKQDIKLAMTAPVMQEKTNKDWMISFVMPEHASLKDLPIPDNKQIQFEQVKGAQYIVITFSGLNSDGNIKYYSDELMAYIKKHNIKTSGEAIMAFYNPPWILPFLRRNEIMIRIQN